ncbi:NAD(P)H-dependent oxidoreductase [Cysteiniphilum halobium]|uniref:NAD(P)H-dependent oxidoreductase n=1 Tax=Cysteiniphilum halobium TaxID=2219059 RepID=UPI000E65B1F7|nr:NAD(P)H-dependent oxidoreductase [Cysteiniphilum halobium]
MSKLLIINAADNKPIAKGSYNQTMTDVARDFFQSRGWSVIVSKLSEGFSTDLEQQKLLEADLIIFQMPVYWFNVPALLKRYMEDVYASGVTHGRADSYGRGGLLTHKHYLLSTTWNAPESAFYGDGTYADLSPDDILAPLHVTQQYIGVKKLSSFHAFDVIQNPDLPKKMTEYKHHLEMVLSGVAVGELA